mgnify:CR=1 FL=1
MINCKDCKKSEVGKDGRVCYIKAIHYQDFHVKDDDSCKYGIAKENLPEQPQTATADKKESSQPITPKVEEKAPTEPKAEVKPNDTVADNSKDVNKSNVSAKVN